MRIVYGVSGEGLGHVFEALEIAAALRREGHAIKILTYGAAACEALADYQPLRIEGLPLYFGPRGLSLVRTLLKNRHVPGFYWRNGRRLREEVAAFRPDVLLTAFEPFTTHLAHRLARPLISMDNQNELLHLDRPPEAGAFAFQLARLATRICTHRAAHYIVKSFRPPPAGAGNRIHFVAPLVQEEIRRLQPKIGRHVLVYLTKPNSEAIELLRRVDESFIVYGQYSGGAERNLIYRRRGPSYLADLSECKAIVGTTGFSLIADAIHLRKPYFGIPLRKQFEQTHNAGFLRSAGIGEYSERPAPADLRRFFSRLGDYRGKLEGLRLNPTEQTETLLNLLNQVGPAAKTPWKRRLAACLL